MQKNTEITKIRNKIFENVKIYYDKKFKNKKDFIPGDTRINYGGRVFDEKELINLVDSSLEFWLTEGRYASQFQESLASFLGIKYCLLTTSGSSANLLAISALKSNKIDDNRRLKKGDEIITIAAAFPTTVFPIIQNNAIPVFVDIELDTYNIDINKLEDALSEKTKAVILAHTLGNPFDIEKIKNFCQDNNLWLIEDNCDALGSKYNNKYTGTFGDISTCSFYPAHQITMGEGGAVLTNDPKLHRILRSIREWGRDCWCAPGTDNTCNKRFEWQLGTLPYGYDHKYIYSEFGYNLKITDMQAAIGVAQLKKLPSFIKVRRMNHERMYEGLKDYADLIILPKSQKNSEPSWFGFMITLKENCEISRSKMIRELENKKIQTRLLFAGNIIRQPVFDKMRNDKKGYRVVGQLYNTNKVMNDSFWLGVYPGITNEMIDYIIAQISELLKKN
ncbi:MAG: lipopolysaccharide biosynthesis protein RfbH [Promethearchaeota archaeon]